MAEVVLFGIALTRRIGEETLGKRAATAQRLAQTRPGARGALLYEACIPLTGEWALGPWPERVPVQVHGMDQDPFFALEGDLDWTPPASSSEPSGRIWPGCSSTPGTGTCSPTARSRRTTRRRPPSSCSAH